MEGNEVMSSGSWLDSKLIKKACEDHNRHVKMARDTHIDNLIEKWTNKELTRYKGFLKIEMYYLRKNQVFDYLKKEFRRDGIDDETTKDYFSWLRADDLLSSKNYTTCQNFITFIDKNPHINAIFVSIEDFRSFSNFYKGRAI